MPQTMAFMITRTIVTIFATRIRDTLQQLLATEFGAGRPADGRPPISPAALVMSRLIAARPFYHQRWSISTEQRTPA
jgi:hypothetical protein